LQPEHHEGAIVGIVIRCGTSRPRAFVQWEGIDGCLVSQFKGRRSRQICQPRIRRTSLVVISDTAVLRMNHPA
jgi:hypothetical protein